MSYWYIAKSSTSEPFFRSSKAKAGSVQPPPRFRGDERTRSEALRLRLKCRDVTRQSFVFTFQDRVDDEGWRPCAAFKRPIGWWLKGFFRFGILGIIIYELGIDGIPIYLRLFKYQCFMERRFGFWTPPTCCHVLGDFWGQQQAQCHRMNGGTLPSCDDWWECKKKLSD